MVERATINVEANFMIKNDGYPVVDLFLDGFFAICEVIDVLSNSTLKKW
jgi:hypothetical protein